MHAAARPINFARSWPFFAGLFVLTLVAFWPSYLSLAFSASSSYTHFHALTASIWMLLLIAQPLAIRSRRLALHRVLGRVSYVVAPLVVLSMMLLAHHRISTASPQNYGIQTYFLYLQVTLAALFALSYILAVATRRTVTFHARFMVCTALTLIDPILIRLLIWIDSSPSWNYQWLTYGATDLTLIVLILLERRSRAGRGVFPAMLALFVATQAPLLMGVTESAGWQGFVRWFAALPWT